MKGFLSWRKTKAWTVNHQLTQTPTYKRPEDEWKVVIFLVSISVSSFMSCSCARVFLVFLVLFSCYEFFSFMLVSPVFVKKIINLYPLDQKEDAGSCHHHRYISKPESSQTISSNNLSVTSFYSHFFNLLYSTNKRMIF